MQSHSLFIHEDSLPSSLSSLAWLWAGGLCSSHVDLCTGLLVTGRWLPQGECPRENQHTWLRSQGCRPITSALITLPDPGTTSGRTTHQYEDRRQPWGPSWTLATMAAFLTDPEKSVLPGVLSAHPSPLNLHTHP